MKPKVIPPSEIAKEIAAIVVDIAAEIETVPPELRQAYGKNRLADILRHFTLADASTIIRVVTEPYAECRSCGAWRQIRDCSGADCLDCAMKKKRESEAASMR